MVLTRKDFAILDKLDLPVKPITVGFFFQPPEGIEKLDKEERFCVMLQIARERSPFYTAPDNIGICHAGQYVLGQADAPPAYISGALAAGLKGMKTARAGRRNYYQAPTLHRNSTDYVAFSTLDKLSFEADILVLAATPKQAAILMHACSWSTGKPVTSKGSFAMECAWLLIYPYISGKVNFFVSDFSIGMRGVVERGRPPVFPDGLIIISIPWELVPAWLDNLQDMPWVNPCHLEDGAEFRDRVYTELGMPPK